MADYRIFMIEIAKNYGLNEWREDVKGVLRTAGMDDTPIVFLFDDTQIVQESFLEDAAAPALFSSATTTNPNPNPNPKP